MLSTVGPKRKFHEAAPFFIKAPKPREQVDYFWDRLTADGGEEVELREA